MAQPDLDFVAPEVQLNFNRATFLCDMFSLGMVICAIYNKGHSLIQANHNTSTYQRRLEQVSRTIIACSLILEPLQLFYSQSIKISGLLMFT